jgi:hypoxanthine phosphoribosyltransferase
MANYERILYSEDEVQQRIDEMTDEIIARYQDKNPLFVCLLRGGAPFATRLVFAITKRAPDFHPELDYATIKTYGDQRTNNPSQLLADILPSTNAADRPVILLDDVLDKGVTAAFATDHFMQNHGAASVELIVLAEKERDRSAYGSAALKGFTVPDDWLTGMGLDDPGITREANRWAGYIAIANH